MLSHALDCDVLIIMCRFLCLVSMAGIRFTINDQRMIERLRINAITLETLDR